MPELALQVISNLPTPESHMAIDNLRALAPFVALALGVGACAPHPGAPTPTRAFPTVDLAKACARDALATAGLLPETVTLPGPDGGVYPGETATSVGGRIITPLGDATRIDLARAYTRIQVGPQGDTTATVAVSVGTLQWDDQNFGAVQPLSATAVRARDAVQKQCMVS